MKGEEMAKVPLGTLHPTVGWLALQIDQWVSDIKDGIAGPSLQVEIVIDRNGVKGVHPRGWVQCPEYGKKTA